MEIDDIKTELLEAATEAGFPLGQAPGQKQYYIDDLTGDSFSVFKEDQNVFNVAYKQPSGNERESRLILSNAPTDGAYEAFKSNHFEFRLGIDSTKAADPNLIQEIHAFLHQSLQEIKVKLQHLNYVEDSGGLLINALNNNMSNATFTKKDIPKSKDIATGTIASEITGTATNDKSKRIKFLLAPTAYGVYNLILVDTSEFFQINFELEKANEVMENVGPLLASVVSRELNHGYPISHFMEKVDKIVRMKGCAPKKFKANPYNTLHIDLTAGKPACMLKGVVINAYGYIINHLDGLHISAENEFMKQEFVIGLDDNFDRNLDQVFVELIAEKNDIESIATKNKGKSIETETIEEIHKVISEIAKAPISCEKVDPKKDNFTCSIKIGAKSYVVVRVIEKFGKEEYFQVSMIDPPTASAANTAGYASPEMFINKFNGYNQSARITQYMKPFFDRISKFTVLL